MHIFHPNFLSKNQSQNTTKWVKENVEKFWKYWKSFHKSKASSRALPFHRECSLKIGSRGGYKFLHLEACRQMRRTLPANANYQQTSANTLREQCKIRNCGFQNNKIARENFLKKGNFCLPHVTQHLSSSPPSSLSYEHILQNQKHNKADWCQQCVIKQ